MSREDPYKYFRVEAAELLERLSEGALAIEKGTAIPGGVAALLRYAHTLKGAARVVKQIPIAEHSHLLEDVLSPYRNVAEGIPRESAAALFTELDAIAADLARLAGPAPQAERVGAATEPSQQRRPTEEPSLVRRAELGELEAVVDGLGEARVELESMTGSVLAIEQGRQLGELLGRQLAAPRRGDPQKLGVILDRAQRLAEDLQTRLSDVERGLRQGIQRLARQLEHTHAAAERLRLVPASSMFTALERALYDAAREVGKTVTFTATGGEIKLDSPVLATVHGALLHVVRNAVVHGIEGQTERAALRKAAVGSVELSISRRGRDVVFSCRDDGAGLDVDAARRALNQSGESAQGLTDDEVLVRLLRGGISTSRRVTGLSGRGVGLDVVREAAERLGGFVKLDSARGRGFGVELCVPFSVAALLVVTVESGGRQVSVPLSSVLTTVRFSIPEVARSMTRESVCHQGEVIPFAALSRALGVPGDPAPRTWSSIIVEGAGGRVALGVDRLLGTRTVVLRPLPDIARATAVVAGASLDALGNPELVLDGDALVAAVQRLAGVEAPRANVSRPILVIDDSLTTRMLEQSILESAGYEVTLATSGEDGLEKARARRYALFLVDVEMPGIDGFTFVDKARRDPELSGIPAVLVSSRSAPEDFARGKAAGARGYIVKDRFDQRELLGLIERLVGT